MLCELEDVRLFLQKQETDTTQDDEIEVLCGAASAAITEHCQREFEDAGSAARTFEYRGGGYLSLAPYDLREVDEIKIDADEDNPTVLEAEEWRLPAPLKDGVATYVRLAPYLIHSRTRWQERLVEITGKWGFETVPATVKQAAIDTVAIWLRRDVSAFTTVFNLDEAHVERPEALPSAVKGKLFTYVRQSYV